MVATHYIGGSEWRHHIDTDNKADDEDEHKVDSDKHANSLLVGGRKWRHVVIRPRGLVDVTLGTSHAYIELI